MKLISQISSPAKAILCGQHAVVYGQNAIAFAVNLRCYANIYIQQIHQQQKQSLNIQILLKNKDKQENLKYFVQSYQICQNIIQSQMQKVKERPFSDTVLQYQAFQQIFQKEIKLLNHQKSQYLASINFKISLFLLKYGINPFKINCQKFLIQIKSQIPIGKCLGSSASFNTVLATSLLLIFNQKIPKIKNQVQKRQVSQQFKQQVNLLSKLFEKVEHGNPSGIDNYVSVYGGLVLYNRNKQPKFIRIQDKNILNKLTEHLIIGFQDSCIPKNTKLAVSNVRQKYLLHQQGNQKYKNIIQQIGQISHKVIQVLSYQNNWIDEFFILIQKNHTFLKQLGLSNQEIQKIVKANTLKGKVCSKITGSGMGGYVLILCTKEFGQLLSKKDCNLITTISRQGLKIDFKQL